MKETVLNRYGEKGDAVKQEEKKEAVNQLKTRKRKQHAIQ